MTRLCAFVFGILTFRNLENLGQPVAELVSKLQSHESLVSKQKPQYNTGSGLNMSQQQIAQLLSKFLGNIAKYSVVAGVGVTALQSSLYTGNL